MSRHLALPAAVVASARALRLATPLLALSAAASCTAVPASSLREAPSIAAASPARGGRATTADIDLAARVRSNGLRAVGTALTVIEEPGRRGVRLADRGEGYRGQVAAWLDDVIIGDGVIEVDIRGKDVFQRSFPGVAFRAEADSVYETVYLRPFNFHATDTLRRQHAVQYMSLPNYDFDRLRKERPEVFENPVVPAPDPNGWVHVRLVLAGNRVSAFVGEGTEPDLVVETLDRKARGRVGLFNAGDFANLRVSPAATP